MNTITKPFMFLVFVMGLIFFINIVLLNITINKADVFMQKSSYILEKNNLDINKSKSEISKLENASNYEVTFKYYYDDKYLDAVKLNVKTEYDYIGRDHTVDINKEKLVLNKQL